MRRVLRRMLFIVWTNTVGAVTQTVGWCVKETGEHTILASSIDRDVESGNMEMYTDVTVIPTTAIIRSLEVPRWHPDDE